MRRWLVGLLLLALSGVAHAQAPVATQQLPSRLDSITAVGHSHTSAATITLTGLAGLYLMIDAIEIEDCAGATTVTGAAPTYMTTTNLPGSPQYQIGSGSSAAGMCTIPPLVSFAAAPLKASAPGTNVTFVLPTFATNQTVSVNVYYHYAP